MNAAIEEVIKQLVEYGDTLGDTRKVAEASLKLAEAQLKEGKDAIQYAIKLAKGNRDTIKSFADVRTAIEDTTKRYKEGNATLDQVNNALESHRRQIQNSTNSNQRAQLMREKQELESLAMRANAGKQFSEGLGRIVGSTGATIATALKTNLQQALASNDGLSSGAQLMKSGFDVANSGMQAVAGGFSKIGAATAGARGSIGLLGMASSVAGAAIGGLGKTVSELGKTGIEFLLAQTQETLAGFKTMASVGAVYSEGLAGMTKTALSAGMTMDQFSKSIVENKDQFTRMGLGATEGSKKLAKAMAAGGDEARRGMFSLGMSMDEQASAYAHTMASLAGPRGKSIATDREVANLTQEYARNLKLVTDITGKSAKEQQAQSQQRQSTMMMQIAMYKMEPEARARFQATLGSIDEASHRALADRMAFHGNIVDKDTAIMEDLSPSLRAYHQEQYKLVQQGQWTADADLKIKKKYADQINEEMSRQGALATAGEKAGSSVEGLTRKAADVMKEMTKFGSVEVAAAEAALKKRQEDAAAGIKTIGPDGKPVIDGQDLMVASQDFLIAKQKLAAENLDMFAGALTRTTEFLTSAITELRKLTTPGEKSMLGDLFGSDEMKTLGITIGATLAGSLAWKGITAAWGAIFSKGGAGGVASIAGSAASSGGIAGAAGTAGANRAGGALGGIGAGADKLGTGISGLLTGLGKGAGGLIEGLFKGISAGVGAMANPAFVLGAAAFGAAVALIGAGIAGASWMLGKALPTLAEGLGSFNDIDGSNLIDVGLGAAALGTGLAVFGMTGVAAGIGSIMSNLTEGLIGFFNGKTPLDKLVEFAKLDIDPAKTKLNAEAFVAFGNAMANYNKTTPGVFSAIGQGVASFFATKPPLDKLLEFSKMDFDAKKVKENGDAVASFGIAMDVLKTATASPGVFASIGDSVSKFFGAKMPYDKLEEFGKLNLDVKKVKDNAEAFKAFAEAMGQWHGVGGARVAGAVSVGPAQPQGGAGSGQAPAPTSTKPPDQVVPVAPPGKPTIPGTIAPVKSEGMDRYLQSIALMESGGDRNAKATTSSASGMHQFLAGTWQEMTKSMGKNYTLNDRFDPEKSTEVAREFATRNKKYLEKTTGREVNNTDQYMAHFLGAGGAGKFLKAMDKDPSQSAAALDRKAAAANQSIYYDKGGRERTVAEVYAIMDNKVKKSEAQLDSGKFGKGGIPQDVLNISKQVQATSNQTTSGTKLTAELAATVKQAEQDRLSMGRGRTGAAAGPTTVEADASRKNEEIRRQYNATIAQDMASGFGNGNVSRMTRSVSSMEDMRGQQMGNQNGFFDAAARNGGRLPVQLGGEVGPDGKRGKDPLSSGFGKIAEIMNKVADLQELSVTHQASLVGLTDDYGSKATQYYRQVG